MDELARHEQGYFRRKVPVKVNESLDAEVFIAQPSKLCTGRVNSSYLELIRSGAFEIGLEADHIEYDGSP